MSLKTCGLIVVSLLALSSAAAAGDLARESPVRSQREAFYGELHLHTSYSFDAYLGFGARLDPNEAYRFARGETVTYLGEPVRRRERLDFLAVTDHAESMGVLSQLDIPDSAISRSGYGKALRDFMATHIGLDGFKEKDPMLLSRFLAARNVDRLPDPIIKAESAAAWRRAIEFANRNYQPGKFTTFIAYEWTAQPGGAVLHRNVIFKGDAAPLPFTSGDSQKPEDLWHWLDKIRQDGHEALAIPHNGNFSNGLMYDWVQSDRRQLDRAYAEQRLTNEPLSEIAQNKGASETHPLLSPNDEFASYEILERASGTDAYRPAGSYLRDALGRGLVIGRELAINPFKYGFVGGSDLHSGLSVSAQGDFAGGHAGVNLGGGRRTKEQAKAILHEPSAVMRDTSPRYLTAGSLTGVWAERNTRESIYAALRRKETFATTGTRMKLRFFGGWSFREDLVRQRDWVSTAYGRGVSMGGDLPVRPRGANAPLLVAWAAKDPNGATLDRMQVIKVWEEGGRQREKVYDVAWSGERKRDSVDLAAGHYLNSTGAAELRSVWRDPQFDACQHAAYYLRVLEIATPRWTTLLALEMDLALPQDVPPTTQQRGWSSPIWYTAPAACG